MSASRSTPDKPALTIPAQIERLRQRGMRIADEARAAHYLSHLNYYRLRGYWMYFECQAPGEKERFAPGTTFDDVIRLYDFDRRLRLEIYDAIERVEVSLRARWAYVLSHRDTCVAHRNPDLFNEHHSTLLGKLGSLYNDRNESFLRRYLDRDEEPPIWAVAEILSFTDLSRWLSNLDSRHLRVAVAEPYDLHESVFCSFIHQLTNVRNVCAHHGRLWNRDLVAYTIKLPKKPVLLNAQLQRNAARTTRLYNILTLLAWMMRIVSPGSTWHTRIRALLEERPDLWEGMGVPEDWQGFELWQEAPP